MRLRWVAALSLLFTYVFFFEYLPPFRWVDIPHDLQYFHYPLNDFAFRSLSAGHLPEWDPTMYCGMSFAGNPQVALFYPPMWLVYAANYGRAQLKYRSLEILVIGHVWLAFLLCFIWLRNKQMRTLACIFGAGIFAYSGYMLEQLSHLGLVCGYAWLPLGLWSIDQAAKSRDWRKLWKLTLASALCFLAGHPPVWFVFFICVLVYAAFTAPRLKALFWTGASLIYSLLVAMVTLLPAREAAELKEIHENYGAGIRNIRFYISYFIPNFYDFRLTTPQFTNHGYEYLYLGAPALFGLACVAVKWKAGRSLIPILAVGLACAVAITNPFDMVWSVIKYSDLLAQLCRSYYFLVGITLSVAALAAAGIDDFIRHARFATRPWLARPWLARPWLAPLSILILALWSARLIWLWRPSGPGFSTGWHSAVEPAVMLAIFSLAMFVIVSETGQRSLWVALALVAAVGVDYKVFGTSLRFNAVRENVDHMFAQAPFPGLDNKLYRKLREHPEYRVGLDSIDPVPMELRHYGLTTPQGGDPLVPAQYRKILAPPGNYYDFVPLDPTNHSLVQLLGVRYFITTDGQPLYPRLLADSDYHLLTPADGYFRVFEFSQAKPPFGWEVSGPSDWVKKTNWSADERAFAVRSDNGGRFILIEQFVPGWQASIDGQPVSIERHHDAFQAIVVPPGEHGVNFRYKTRGLRTGAIVSVISLLCMLLLVFRRSSPALAALRP